MTENKTKQTDLSVEDFFNTIENEEQKKDCLTIVELMQRITQKPPKIWGTNMIGFGNYHYKYKSGREGNYYLVGFAPRKNNITLYILAGFDNYENLKEKLGKFKTGKSCLYIKQLKDIDLIVLEELIVQSIDYMKVHYQVVD